MNKLIFVIALVINLTVICLPKATMGVQQPVGELSIGDEHLGGVVFYLFQGDDGRQHGLVVSATETLAAWQSPVSLVNAGSTTDGPENYKLMVDSPAKDWITSNFSSEWYLPTLNELSILWVVRFKINEALQKGSHTPLAMDGYYWSSRERGERFAYFFNFEDGDPYTYGKEVKYSVRAVMAF